MHSIFYEGLLVSSLILMCKQDCLQFSEVKSTWVKENGYTMGCRTCKRVYFYCYPYKFLHVLAHTRTHWQL